MTNIIVLADVRKAREVEQLRARLQQIDPLTLPLNLLITWLMLNVKLARCIQNGMLP
jgi:hypothetical protein